jgi:hypothetical protein
VRRLVPPFQRRQGRKDRPDIKIVAAAKP